MYAIDPVGEYEFLDELKHDVDTGSVVPSSGHIAHSSTTQNHVVASISMRQNIHGLSLK